MTASDWQPPEDPPRPSRQELASMLQGLAAGDDVPVVNRSVESLGWGIQSVRLASGWRLRVWWLDDGSMGPLSGAMAPDGRRWVLGCDRWPDWEAGSQAEILDPLQHLITPLDRLAIGELLQIAEVVEPQPLPEPAPVEWVPWTEEELMLGG